MRMICQGPGCGQVFEAKRKNAKWCSRKCSMRASRAGQLGEPTPAPDGAEASAPEERPEVHTELLPATRDELKRAGRETSWAGWAALALAARIDAGGAETGSALASMIKEHAAAMERALRGGKTGDPVEKRQDEVAARRAEREHATATS